MLGVTTSKGHPKLFHSRGRARLGEAASVFLLVLTAKGGSPHARIALCPHSPKVARRTMARSHLWDRPL